MKKVKCLTKMQLAKLTPLKSPQIPLILQDLTKANHRHLKKINNQTLSALIFKRKKY